MFQALTKRVLEPNAFGLDISDLTIKFCRVQERNGGLELDYYGEVDVPQGVVVQGEIQKPSELVRTLKEKLKGASSRSLRDHFCVASLPEEKSFVRIIEMPDLPPEDVAKAIRWEVEGIVPMPLEEIIFDFEILPPKPARLRQPHASSAALDPQSLPKVNALLTAFPKKIVESYVSAIKEAGYQPMAIELESQAISRSLVYDFAHAKPTILVDIGATRTSFIIFAGGSIVFTKSIPVGGHDFDVSISETLGVSLDEAQQIKIEAGLYKNFKDGRVFEALSVHIQKITNELDEQVTFYRTHPARHREEHGDIETIILCGGDANLIGLEKFIGTSNRKQTLLGDPFVNFRLPQDIIPQIPKNKSLKYTTAIGLALRAAGR